MCVFSERFLSDGDISVDIGVTAPPVITANYIESYHKVRMQLKAPDLSSINTKSQLGHTHQVPIGTFYRLLLPELFFSFF